MAHRNIQIPTFKSPPEERENGRDLFLEHDSAFPLYHALCLRRAALPVGNRKSEWSKHIAGDASLTEKLDRL